MHIFIHCLITETAFLFHQLIETGAAWSFNSTLIAPFSLAS